MILIIGTIALDTVKTPFGQKEKILGGSASHFSVAASLTTPVNMIGVVGNDFPQKYLDYFKDRKIDISGIKRSDKPTFHWKGHYNYDLDIAHTDETLLGALSEFKPTLTAKEKKAKFIFLGNIDPSLQLNLLKQVDKPDFVGMDSMNYWIDSKPKELWAVIKKVDALFLNSAEIKQLANEASLIKAAHIVQKKGPKIVIVKSGEHGVLVISKDFTFSSNAYPTKNVKDPTGAGDSFAGGFVSYMYSKMILNKENLKFEEIVKQAIVWGASVASFCVEDFSTNGLNKVTKKKILERCHKIHEITKFIKHK